MKIGNSQLIKNIDNYCINDLGIPSTVLMENAAIKVVKNIDFEKFKSFTIVCGTGNNGGDGLAVARQLFSMNMQIDVFIVGNHSMSKDCNVNYDILKNRYGVDHVAEDLCVTYDAIGKKIGARISGGEIDYDRVSTFIVNDMKQDVIKCVTFDRLED